MLYIVTSKSLIKENRLYFKLHFIIILIYPLLYNLRALNIKMLLP